MKRTILTLLVGLAAGLGSHLVYYRYNEPVATDTLEGQLAWMKIELKLTDRQFARVMELHQASHPRLRAMAAQVEQMQSEFVEFEKIRRATDRVDFLEFAHFVENRRQLNNECLDSTRQLVLASAEIMTTEQRQQYIRLIATAEPLVESLLN